MEELKKKLQDEIAGSRKRVACGTSEGDPQGPRAHGDLSENAEYHAAKERQGLVNARLGQLQKRLRELSMVDMARIPLRDKVGLGSKVTVFDTAKDEEVEYRLVTSEDADVAKGLISTTSPIGRGLLGKKVGDTVRIFSGARRHQGTGNSDSSDDSRRRG